MPQALPQRILAFSNKAIGLANTLKTKVGLSEAYDRHNPPAHLPKVLEGVAIWDTGATHSVITQEVVDALGLKPIAITDVKGVHGTNKASVYLVCIYLPNKLNFPTVRVTLGELPDAKMLIGMDIILTGDFAVSNYEGKTTFSFRFPSCGEIDFVKDIQAMQAPSQQPKVPAKTITQRQKDKNKRRQARKDRRSK